MTSGSFAFPTMQELLARWLELDLDRIQQEADWHTSMGANMSAEHLAARRTLSEGMAKKAEPYLDAFLRDNGSLSAKELEQLAGHLSPGGAHTGGLLVRLVLADRFDADPLLVAAVVRYNWHGGKRGFQFLPDAAGYDDDDAGLYECEAADLMELFDHATDGDPKRILTGDDLAFFDSLPERFTVYRGCPGISAVIAGLGVCWTLSRDVAEWFACRGAGEPVVITARVRKADVRLAKASELEVVCTPRRGRPIKVRPHRKGWRPEMKWSAPASSKVLEAV